jgi:dTDP-4-amino-4,6-dideoxygalactose transaminase
MRPTPIPLCDLAPQQAVIADEVNAAVQHVVASQKFILGETVSSFERQFAEKIGVSCAVGVANGSDALALALLAAGVKPGDGVVTTPYTFVATGSAIARVGAVPIFADVEKNGVHISASAIDEAIATSALPVKAVVAVHLFGFAADMNAISAVAEDHDAIVIEDAAQAFGTRVREKSAGAMSLAGCFSFFPSKTLGGWGDGGAVVSNDEAFAEKIKSLRAHGFDRTRGGYVGAGDNSRLDAIQAAVLGVKLKYVSSWIESRRKLVDSFRSHFFDGSSALEKFIELPVERADEYATFNPLVVKAKNRDALAGHLHDHGIEARAYYTHLLSAEPRFASSPQSHTPNAQEAADSRLALPLFFGMTEDQIARIVDSIRAFYK